MNTIQVTETAYRGAGWAVALIRVKQVIASRYVDSARDGFPSAAELRAALEALKAEPAVIAAESAAATAYEQLEAATERGDDDDVIAELDAAFEAAAVRIRHGMMSGGLFHLDFTRAEAAALRIPAELRP